MERSTVFNGPGKYDDLLSQAREQAGAHSALLLIAGGDKGAGFSVQGTMQFIEGLPETLEDLARALRKQMGQVQ